MSLRDRTIPVFVYPTELTFYVINHHKQVLTVYNPYDFPVKYQIFANTSDKYTVVEPNGTIAPHACVDLLVRHKVPTQANCHARDKFMVTMLDATTNHILGKRCVPATLLPGDKELNVSEEGSQSNYMVCESSLREKTRTELDPAVRKYFIVLSAIFIVMLLLPTKSEEQEETSIPTYLHVATGVKIIVAYALGLITMVLLKPC